MIGELLPCSPIFLICYAPMIKPAGQHLPTKSEPHFVQSDKKRLRKPIAAQPFYRLCYL
jgi:hypothetical protein